MCFCGCGVLGEWIEGFVSIICLLAASYATRGGNAFALKKVRNKMGRGVSAGGGQSSLGYLFGGEEAPKPAGNNAEVPKQGSDTSSGASEKFTTTTTTASPPETDVPEKVPAGIQGSQANNYFRADGQNCGNFITIDLQLSSTMSQDRPSTKVHAAPGGGSSLGYLFGDGKN
ncbi:hypothetical protein SAY87_004246 [Trapa incisa]|uniref:Uncharacterized protein n=1 Tax=Trapa incisa TaxID=236973 RepID=A0AAN7JNN7_9MYRT|nr:hypothetical protein SAY87_004246 [Trapa incisa]